VKKAVTRSGFVGEEPPNLTGLHKRKQRPVRTVNIASTTRAGFAAELSHVVAIDSAKKTPAVVEGVAERIVRAYFDATPGRTDNSVPCPDVAVYEHARCRPGDPRPQDILDESCGGALCAGSFCAARVVPLFPDDWAASTSKPARHERVWRELDATERETVAAGGGMTVRQVANHIDAALKLLSEGREPKYSHKIHNLLDAAGIFLFAVGRRSRGMRR
jgi:hypothetical protein